MLKTPATLRRWIAATGGDLPYPASSDQITIDLAVALEQRDPELLQILQGNAPARLELAVMDGTFADAAPNQQAVQDAETQARIAELQPLADQGNITAAFELRMLTANKDEPGVIAPPPLPQQQPPAHALTDRERAIFRQHGIEVG